MIRPGSPVPPIPLPDVFEDETGDEGWRLEGKDKSNSWMETRIRRNDIDKIPMKQLVTGVIQMLVARSPSKPDFLNYADTFLTYFQKIAEEYSDREIVKLKNTEKQDEADLRDLRYGPNDYGPLKEDPKWFVEDRPEVLQRRAENYDSDFEEDPWNYKPKPPTKPKRKKKKTDDDDDDYNPPSNSESDYYSSDFTDYSSGSGRIHPRVVPLALLKTLIHY